MSIQAMEGVSQLRPHLEDVKAVMARVEKADVVLPAARTRRHVDGSRLFGFETMAHIDGITVRKMMQKVSLADLIMSLTGADKSIKEAVLSNMPAKLREISEITVSKMESGLLPVNVISRCRNIITDAFLELMREA